MKILLKQIGDYKRDTIITPVFTVLEVVAELLVPFVIASLIDKGIEAGNLRNVYLYGALMIVLAFFGLAFGILAGRFAASASSGFACNLRQSMFENIQTFSFSNIDKFSTAGLVTRMTTDVTNMQMAFQMCLRIALRAPLMLICSMVMCLLINARLSIIFLAAIVVLAAALALIMSRAMKIFSKVFHRYDDLNASVQENIAAIRVVKAFVREDCENEKFCKAAVRLYELFVRAEKLQALNLPVMMFIVYGCILAISWFGAHFILAGSMTTGSLTSLFSYVMTAFSSLMMLSMIFVMMTMSTASGKRIAEVLEETAGITNPPSTPICQVRDGSVDFNHVAFSYRQGSGEKTLDNVDLHIKSGETIGVIGGTGCGKSSLVSLISRLYDVDSGSVKVGGEDVRNYDLETLRSQVAVVLQKNVLFSGTVLENLSWGKKMGHMDEYREACRMSCADEFLERLPEHYESWVERGGANFSGGQKQRLCIARALLRHPKVLILDDSTSAVDTATDAKIRKALRTVIPGTTKIIIAQRISSVQDADRILVLDSGRISGFDTHENLLKSNAIYREIYEAQTKGGGDFDHEQTVE
ncbi:ABC transporter ATP-binding protein [uncultured Oscillibacter sp.]|uniref:ABC transporter ATP-binding protein n=1 Tax=uncultured Oscillibacter sp. TaxID=876091 RepID=UPI0034297CA3